MSPQTRLQSPLSSREKRLGRSSVCWQSRQEQSYLWLGQQIPSSSSYSSSSTYFSFLLKVSATWNHPVSAARETCLASCNSRPTTHNSRRQLEWQINHCTEAMFTCRRDHTINAWNAAMGIRNTALHSAWPVATGVGWRPIMLPLMIGWHCEPTTRLASKWANSSLFSSINELIKWINQTSAPHI